MKAPKQLRKPENWTDFETLCKKLWGEIWNCPEIKKNGRKGQAQHGVDIYGIPSFDPRHYYGIQCKLKDEYTNKQLSRKEIDEELQKALHFKPQLKKLYFATTANKDAVIEQYMREKNVEFKNKGLFEVYLYNWEEIVDLIDENKNTYDWYTKSQNFKTNQSCKLTFHDSTEKTTVKVPFKQSVTVYHLEEIPILQTLVNLHNMPKLANIMPKFAVKQNFRLFGPENLSWCKFHLILHNTGSWPIEEYKIFLRFSGAFLSVGTTKENEEFISTTFSNSYNVYIDNTEKTGKIIPQSKVLVGEDSIKFDDIFIKPYHRNETVIIHWKLVSRDYQIEDTLTLNIEPDINRKHTLMKVESSSKVRVEEGEIEDCFANE